MRVRRPSRAQETSALHRGRALLHMQATLATSQPKWLRAVDEWINDLDMRSDGRENRRRLARVLGFNADWKTLTTNTLTWSTIAERTGMSRATVARHLLALHEAGWIGRVAAGRSAAAKQAAGWKSDDAFINDAPVYALTQPVDDAAVDINETPPTVSGYKEFPARAREAETPPGAAMRPSSTKAADGRPSTVPAHRTLPAWPGHVTPSSKDERGLAGREWARRVPALRKLSAEHLRFLAKDFFTAGWTIRDLITALDSLPDGRAHGQFVGGQWVPYSGADGIPAARLGHWVSWRLNAWRNDDQTVKESPTQTRLRREETAKKQQQVQRQVREEERLRNQAQMATPEGQAAKQACLAQFASRPKRRVRRR
ncbi:winged helix-turn-helix transcriptional regulator [Brevibacterium aurantiacum]|nr:winged helix-turn-helix transcriptional regulator [Brevibacterium aurantiacum]RCS93463.1 winged helix-turn-helix transcriptional regulator [Brevibacterium aurantiacum]